MASIQLGAKDGDDNYNLGTSLTEADIPLTLGTIAIGNASGDGVELDVSTDKGIMIGNGTTATVVALSGNATMTNGGVVTVDSATASFAVGGDLTVNGGQSALNFTDNGAVGATFTLFQDSTSPASPDEVGIVAFDGRDDGAGANTYATISGVIDDPSAGATFGSVAVQVQNGTGSLETAAVFAHDGSTATLETGLITTEANVGTPGTNVTAEEYGDGYHHVTILTLTATSLGAPNAGNNSAHGALIYTFPAGTHLHSVTGFNVGLTLGGVTTDTPDVGVGSVIGSGAQALLSGVGATSEDYITGQTWGVALDGTATVVEPIGAVAGLMTGISLNGAADVKALHLNAADGWNAGVTGNLTADGTVTLVWTKTS